jgi:hypothetical protein
MSKYTTCNLCNSQVPEGHPCMRCVKANRMKKNDTQITPESIENFVKVLKVNDGDIIVIKSDLCTSDIEYIEQITEGIKNLFKDRDIGLMFLSSDAELILLRKENE